MYLMFSYFLYNRRKKMLIITSSAGQFPSFPPEVYLLWPKGHLISEQMYGVLNFPKMQEILPGFLSSP